LNCLWHPQKRAVASCKDCGAEFCIECVRETDQTTLCPDCYRRKLGEIAREFSSPVDKKEGPLRVSAMEDKPAPREREEPSLFGEEAPQKGKTKEAAPPRRDLIGRRRGRGKGERPARPAKQEKPAEPAPEEPEGDFLSQGPDEDFSFLVKEKRGEPSKIRWRRTATPPAAEAIETPSKPGKVSKPEAVSSSEENLLKDVVSTLLKPDTGEAAAVDLGVEEAAEQPAGEAKVRREERAERWSFLAQPRTSEYTILTVSWWRSTFFIVLMLVIGALLWALPNAFLIPKDQEYGIHSLIIGIIIGLAFWWKAGKKHSTKLAVQVALTAFFALFLGEFLHWFLIIVKNQAFRTVFFDLISFQFLWENGPEIMKNTVEAMFPLAFLWVLLLPTVTAFLIGFGMPPIPEIFSQMGRAMKGQSPGEKEAGHGLES